MQQLTYQNSSKSENIWVAGFQQQQFHAYCNVCQKLCSYLSCLCSAKLLKLKNLQERLLFCSYEDFICLPSTFAHNVIRQLSSRARTQELKAFVYRCQKGNYLHYGLQSDLWFEFRCEKPVPLSLRWDWFKAVMNAIQRSNDFWLNALIAICSYASVFF